MIAYDISIQHIYFSGTVYNRWDSVKSAYVMNSIMEEIESFTGVSVEQIRNRNHHKKLLRLRPILAHVFVQIGFTQATIADWMYRGVGTVNRYLSEHEENMTDPIYRALLAQVIENLPDL